MVFGLGTIIAGVSLIGSVYFVHLLSVFIAFGAGIAVQFLTWRALQDADESKWGRYRKYSLISGVLSVIMLFVFIYTITAFPYLSTTTFHGLSERIFVAVPLLWMEVTSIKILEADFVTSGA